MPFAYIPKNEKPRRYTFTLSPSGKAIEIHAYNVQDAVAGVFLESPNDREARFGRRRFNRPAKLEAR